RLLGDDFVVLVEGVISRADAAAVAERVLAAVSRPIRVDDVDTIVRASIGVALNSSPGVSSGELLRMAEVAMFAAKRNGKARYEVYEEIVHGSELATMRTRSELKHAIDGGELVLYFQPIFELAPERVVGLEALVRAGWFQPEPRDHREHDHARRQGVGPRAAGAEAPRRAGGPGRLRRGVLLAHVPAGPPRRHPEGGQVLRRRDRRVARAGSHRG